MVKCDRGRFVRRPEDLAGLLKPFFTDLHLSIRHDLLRTAYTHVQIEASVGSRTNKDRYDTLISVGG